MTDDPVKARRIAFLNLTIIGALQRHVRALHDEDEAGSEDALREFRAAKDLLKLVERLPSPQPETVE